LEEVRDRLTSSVRGKSTHGERRLRRVATTATLTISAVERISSEASVVDHDWL
jgi:hypothetical protein